MKDITSNEMHIVLQVLKSPEVEYNATNLAKLLNISAMGSLKIARRLDEEGILKATQKGKAIFYTINHNEYSKQYLKFILQREAEHTFPYIKRWITDLKKIKNAEAIILFGSILTKHNDAKDVDTLIITNEKSFVQLKKNIETINTINVKKIHPIYQTREDVINNIRKGDKVILNALKGIVVTGEDTIIEVLTA